MLKNDREEIIPRGRLAVLPHGGLPEIISPYLIDLIKKTGGAEGPIGRQFVAHLNKERKAGKEKIFDPLAEDEHEVAPGLVYKYRGQINKNGEIIRFGRVLWTITRFCGSYCRFCTRGREVGILPDAQNKNQPISAISQKPFLDEAQINEVFSYLREKREINEVIISGGDPLVTPRPYLEKITKGLSILQAKGDLEIIRLGTRLPIINPRAVAEWHYEALAQIKNPYLMVHLNHPAELTAESINVLSNFRRKALANVLSQTVLLRDVNDSVKTLSELFILMTKEGIRPYYVYQNDPVCWAKHFTVPIKKAIKLWEKLRPRLSGLATTARFVIDTPFGFGKIPVPEGQAWKVDYSHFHDFQKKKHSLK